MSGLYEVVVRLRIDDEQALRDMVADGALESGIYAVPFANLYRDPKRTTLTEVLAHALQINEPGVMVGEVTCVHDEADL